jgi:hypothetical protein
VIVESRDDEMATVKLQSAIISCLALELLPEWSRRPIKVAGA